jgi:hypothetical protein
MKKLYFITIFHILMIRVYSQACTNNDCYYDEATITIKTEQSPPPLPYYNQPACPQDGYLWQPGYWAWGTNDYYWVPGVWVAAPSAGLVWTPGYWSYRNSWYGWHPGYWGSHVGYYGGIDYDFGYFGNGFYGGKWEGDVFQYNTAVWKVNRAVVHNIYKSNVPKRVERNLSSYNGFPGGIRYQPSADEQAAIKETHRQMTPEQAQHQQAAAGDRSQYFRHIEDKPTYTSMSKPGGTRFDKNGRAKRNAAAQK